LQPAHQVRITNISANRCRLKDRVQRSLLFSQMPRFGIVSDRACPDTHALKKSKKSPSCKRALCRARRSKFSSCLSWLVLAGKNDRHHHPESGHRHHSRMDKYRLDLLKQKVPGPYSQPGKRQKDQETQSFFSFWIPHGLNKVILATNLRLLIS